ncbi:hypothetical protein RvY_02360 [Ramazzottius varieornatus]|uniref:Uncharacterized protein n=1 Tax=Ramazzottius varieornatus TaxID=947166 RepID=A0A1D1UUK3_RAMVA|nr:hypothetical protein RvY_02360 [Ramazzottius varieornatus]
MVEKAVYDLARIRRFQLQCRAPAHLAKLRSPGGCLYSSTNVAQTTTAAPTTRSTTSIKTNAIFPYINESGVDNVS